MKQKKKIDWEQVRINASISILNAILETTKHSVLEELAIDDIFAKAAVGYADKLIQELIRTEDSFIYETNNLIGYGNQQTII